jgi:hypothetical protein
MEMRSGASVPVSTVVLAVALQFVAGCQAREPVDATDDLGVGGLSKRVELGERNDFLRNACEQWTLTAADVQYFFQYARPIASEEHHNVYDVLPCAHFGKVMINGQWHDFEINAGAFGRLNGSLYGCQEQCANLFVPFGL